MKALREWLKDKRLAQNLTMAKMAEKLDITEGYYSLIESGERQKKMDVGLVIKLSVILEMPIDQIVELETR